MKTIEEKLNYIKDEIKTTPKSGIYKIKETTKEVLDFYTNKKEVLEKVSFEQLKKYSFVREILIKCETKEKLSFTENILDCVYRLETHSFAPELNKLNFINNKGFIIEIKTPQKTTIEDSVSYLIKSLSLTQLKNLIKTTKKQAKKVN